MDQLGLFDSRRNEAQKRQLSLGRLERLRSEQQDLIQDLKQRFDRWKSGISLDAAKDVARQIEIAIEKEFWPQVCSKFYINSLTYKGLKRLHLISQDIVLKQDEIDDELDLTRRRPPHPRQYHIPIKPTRLEELYQ